MFEFTEVEQIDDTAFIKNIVESYKKIGSLKLQ
ncbi:MAG: hypothetical protein ACJA0T_000087 [Colwellia sp.]|jgi:hypothetical protein